MVGFDASVLDASPEDGLAGLTQPATFSGKMADSTSLNLVGGRVKAARLRSSPVLTQVQLSARLKKLGFPIDRASISKIETGTRCVPDYEVVALAKALSVSVGWLLVGRKKA